MVQGRGAKCIDEGRREVGGEQKEKAGSLFLENKNLTFGK